eukprot:CAMPEP_0201544428 /NCGR_PEP_ID=MMETSP0173_2-20130828/1031_1 /ASSEMBLY_ACC=CAM_ASM_000268 /TAXON_ID=218659 /ORGANISM="Vexillifera sp., Strain DIVA3 564/2" /LENGTH=312 /DNA_ID=CAMNT_0047952531 /DNA_START=59 /DNA_END=997 /DNA_ORIENTATION=-
MSSGSEICEWANDLNWTEFSGNKAIETKLTDLRKVVAALQDDSSSSSSDESSSSGGESSSGDGESASGEGSESIDPEKRIKLVVVGDGAVGKTSLLISYATGKFPEEYVPTVFENYSSKIEVKDQTVFLHLWDTAGQEDYDRLRPLSYPNSDIVFLVFATTSKDSFDSIEEKWYPEINHYLPDVPYILVGSKVDLRDAGEKDKNAETTVYVTKEQGQELAEQIEAVRYIELSSKTRQGLEEAFAIAVQEVWAFRGIGETTSSLDTGNAPDGSSTGAGTDGGDGGASSSTDQKKPTKKTPKRKKKEKKQCTLL